MAAEDRTLEFEKMSVDNTDIFIRNVPKSITNSMAKLIFPTIQEYFKQQKEDE